MQKIHYYFGWFNNNIPEQLAKILQGDIPDRKSLVMICTIPSDYGDSTEMSGLVKDTWLGPAGIVFDEYHSIDYRVTKERAQELLRDASAILLHGGRPGSLNAFLAEYELAAPIKDSNATVIMGASAGAMNMSAKFVYASKMFDGLGLDRFAMESHALVSDIETLAQSELVLNELLPLSKALDVYVGCEESAIRVKNGKIEVMGGVYLISDLKIQKYDALLS